MKTIQFTNEEIEKLKGMININPISTSIVNKITLANMSMSGCTITEDDLEIVVTPAKAFEKVSERKAAARIENEKRVAKQMIEDLTLKHEKLTDEYVELNNRYVALEKENEALNLQITNN